MPGDHRAAKLRSYSLSGQAADNAPQHLPPGRP